MKKSAEAQKPFVLQIVMIIIKDIAPTIIPVIGENKNITLYPYALLTGKLGAQRVIFPNTETCYVSSIISAGQNAGFIRYSISPFFLIIPAINCML